MQTKTHCNGIVHHCHLTFVQTAHMFPKPLLVDGSDLFQQNHRVLTKTHASAGNIDMGGKPGLPRLAGDGRSDHSWRMAVSGIILYDQDGPGTPQLTANHRGKVGIEYVPSFHCAVHKIHTPCIAYLRYRKSNLCNAVILLSHAQRKIIRYQVFLSYAPVRHNVRKSENP